MHRVTMCRAQSSAVRKEFSHRRTLIHPPVKKIFELAVDRHRRNVQQSERLRWWRTKKWQCRRRRNRSVKTIFAVAYSALFELIREGRICFPLRRSPFFFKSHESARRALHDLYGERSSGIFDQRLQPKREIQTQIQPQDEAKPTM